MIQTPFIFSDQPRYRIRRHLAFWLVWFVVQAFLYSFVAVRVPITYGQQLALSFVESFVFLSAHMFLSYSLMYWVIPRFILKHRYGTAAVATIMLFILSAIISAMVSLLILAPIRMYYVPLPGVTGTQLTALTVISSLTGGLRGAVTIGGLAASIKLIKYWYLKEQRNVQLQKQNAEVQLQLLKAQVHPHFLFNTLNNIYSLTQKTAPVAADLVAGLAAILRYMLYESSHTLVPLAKDFTMLREYINLEQVRYGDKLDLHVDLPAVTDNLQMAPLLLLPLVENAFKHGASTMLEQPWVNISASIENNRLHFKIMNGKAPVQTTSDASGIGIRNVSERLTLLYPDKHDLQISDEDDVFIVTLKLQLSVAAISQTVNVMPEQLAAINA